MLGLHLAKELCEVDEEGDHWLQVTRKIQMLPTLFTTLEISLRGKQNLHFTEASLHLLLTLARTQQVGGGTKAPFKAFLGGFLALADAEGMGQAWKQQQSWGTRPFPQT